MVTIKEIAERAGVAKSTVSNVLSGKKNVSPEITKKVLDICEELDFVPNFYASTLSSKTKTRIIGLFLESQYKRFYSHLIEAIIQKCTENKYSLLIYSGINNVESFRELKQGKSPIDGAIILAPTVDDERINRVSQNLIPLIIIGHPQDALKQFNYVDIDNVALTYNITKEMIDKGYRNICLLNANEKLMISKERDKGYKKAFSEYNLSNELIYHCQSTHTDELYYHAKEAIRKGYNAFITASGTVASYVYRAAYDSGKVIGKDFAVFSLGYSYNESLYFEPSLSYAAQDYYQIGSIAVSMLFDRLDNKQIENQIIDSVIHKNESFK